jgi:hypothetical protein
VADGGLDVYVGLVVYKGKPILLATTTRMRVDTTSQELFLLDGLAVRVRQMPTDAWHVQGRQSVMWHSIDHYM